MVYNENMSKTNRTTVILVGVGVLLVVALFGIAFWQKGENSDTVDSGDERVEINKFAEFDRSLILEMAEKNNYKYYNLDKVLPADEQSGEIAENIKGSAKAKVLIFEYADYQCSHCAEANDKINQLVEDYDGKVAVVFRVFVLNFTNSVAAASAANAAGLQGYWAEYKDLLFANQGEWIYLSGDKLTEQFEEYFEKVSDGKGDVKKFRADMLSEAVAKKVAFDTGIALELSLSGTPTFMIDGEKVGLADLRSKIEAKLK